MNFKNILVSVSDKTGLVEFLAPMVNHGARIVATGGTLEHLRKAGLQVVDLSQQTDFPEVMGGRVKTLHPRVHMPLLARATAPEDFALLQQHGLEPFDLCIVNLYPFESTLQTTSVEQELVEKIDIGGPSLLRGAAKNFSRMTVVCDPSDYQWVGDKGANISLSERKWLAMKVFSHTARYDALIAEWFAKQVTPPTSTSSINEASTGSSLEKTLGGVEFLSLRYGENPDQHAAWYRRSGDTNGLHSAKILQGKPLSYNNVLDLDSATELVKELNGCAVVAVKHNNPCGVAEAETAELALSRALKSDPVSVFGGIVAVNFALEVDHLSAFENLFLECVIAPKVSEKAREILIKKKNLRVLEWPSLNVKHHPYEHIRSVAGGFLLQSPMSYSTDTEQWKFLGEVPNQQRIEDLKFAEKVVASLKSNAIALVLDRVTLGLGMGQVNRVDAVRHAIERMQSHHADQEKKNLILASDAFFPFPDAIELAAKAGVKWVLQPGGSVRDEEVFQVAKKFEVNMVITGGRHFRH